MPHQVKNRVGRPFVALTLALLALFALSYHGFRGSVVDEAMMLSVTAEIVDAHTVALNQVYPALKSWTVPDSDPNHPIYSKYAIGQSVLAVPMYALARLIPVNINARPPNGQPFIPALPVLAMLTIGSFVTLLSAYGVFFSARILGASDRAAALIGVLYAVTTQAWPYAKTFFNEPSTACAVIWAVYFAIRFRRDDRVRDGLLTGLWLGAAILFRTTSVVFAPIVLFYLLPRLRAWMLPLIGISAGVLITLAYNAYRFGSITESGYEPGFGRAPWEALLGYLISPSRSLFLFNPILLLAIPGAWLLLRRLPRETLMLIALAVAPIPIYAAWWAWDGGGSLGPRFLLPALPLLILLIIPLFQNPRWRVPLIAFGVAGFALQVLSNLPLTGDFYLDMFGARGLTAPQVNWIFSDSIIANLWLTYAHHHIDSFVLGLLPIESPIMVALIFGAAAVLLVAIMLTSALRLPGDLEASPEKTENHTGSAPTARGLG